MASTPTPPVETTASQGPGHPAEALVPSPPSGHAAPIIPANSPATRLPVELEVSIPLRAFRVRNLLALQPGNLIESEWVHDEDVPIGSGDVQLAWSEFEVVDTQLAVRLTRLV